jgi:hypothetical protein
MIPVQVKLRRGCPNGVGFELATKDYLPGVNELIARMIEEPSLDDSPIIKQWWNT